MYQTGLQVGTPSPNALSSASRRACAEEAELEAGEVKLVAFAEFGQLRRPRACVVSA